MIFKVSDNREETNTINVNQPRKMEPTTTTENPHIWSARVPQHREDYDIYYRRSQPKKQPNTYYRKMYNQYKKKISALPLYSSSSSVLCSTTALVSIIFTVMVQLVL